MWARNAGTVAAEPMTLASLLRLLEPGKRRTPGAEPLSWRGAGEGNRTLV